MYGILLPSSETNAFIISSANSVSPFPNGRGGFFWSRGGSLGINVRVRENGGWPFLVYFWLPRSEVESWVLCTFKLLPVSWPSQAKELDSQFIVLRTEAGLLCLQLPAFYGTGNVV